MRYAKKRDMAVVRAYELGAGSDMEKQLLEEGSLVLHRNGRYELFSKEAVNGWGQLASAGDYFKVDTVGDKHFPYPNSRQFFLDNHTHIKGDEYYQTNKPLPIWQAGDEMCAEMEYLLKNGKLVIDAGSEQRYFNAELWGSLLSAARDAVIVFYEITKDSYGVITDISFGLVSRKDFDERYTICINDHKHLSATQRNMLRVDFLMEGKSHTLEFDERVLIAEALGSKKPPEEAVYTVGSKQFQGEEPVKGKAIEVFTDGGGYYVSLKKDKYGDKFIYEYESVPTFDSGDRLWDSCRMYALMYDGKNIDVIAFKGGAKLARIEVYKTLMFADEAFKPYIEKLGYPKEATDKIQWWNKD